MVLGFFIATGIETVIELGFWSFRKIGSVVYWSFYGDEPKNDIQMTDDEIKELRKEISELKDLLGNKDIKTVISSST